MMLAAERVSDLNEFEAVSRCLVCDADSFETLLDRDLRGLRLTFVRCHSCGLVLQNPRMTRAALQRYFGSDFFIHDSKTEGASLDDVMGYYDYATWEGSYRRTARYRLGLISGRKAPPARFLEIGSATGFFLDEARKAGFDVRGLDASSQFASAARAKGFEVDEGFVESFPLPAERYDVVCCFGGLTCWYDPVAGLRNVRRALKRDGVFALNHMNRDHWLYRVQGYRNFDYNHACLVLWSQKTMEQCLKKAGFEVLHRERELQNVSVGRVAEYLRLPRALRAVQSLGVNEWSLSFPIPFTEIVLCRPVS